MVRRNKENSYTVFALLTAVMCYSSRPCPGFTLIKLHTALRLGLSTDGETLVNVKLLSLRLDETRSPTSAVNSVCTECVHAVAWSTHSTTTTTMPSGGTREDQRDFFSLCQPARFLFHVQTHTDNNPTGLCVLGGVQ